MKRKKQSPTARCLRFALVVARERRFVGRSSIPHADKRRKLLVQAERRDRD